MQLVLKLETWNPFTDVLIAIAALGSFAVTCLIWMDRQAPELERSPMVGGLLSRLSYLLINIPRMISDASNSVSLSCYQRSLSTLHPKDEKDRQAKAEMGCNGTLEVVDLWPID